MDLYDLIIIGSGPAGLTASIYASCYHLKHLVIGSLTGGQLQFAPDILNYPGFEEISGKELTERMAGQARKRGGEIIEDSVVNVVSSQRITNPHSTKASRGRQESRIKGKKENIRDTICHDPNIVIHDDKTINNFTVYTKSGKQYETRSLILATGMERRKLNVPGEIEYTGKGVHYCATCEKQDYDGKTCVVVGGGNSAVQAAVELSTAAKKVYVIYRGTELRGDAVWLDRISHSTNIVVIYETFVTQILGDGKKITSLILNSKKENIKEKVLETDKIFIEIGGVPGTALIIPLGVEVDDGGYIRVNSKLETNIPGIFAAGDIVRFGFSIEQIVSSTGLGARAATSVFSYITGSKAGSLWGKTHIKR